MAIPASLGFLWVSNEVDGEGRTLLPTDPACLVALSLEPLRYIFSFLRRGFPEGRNVSPLRPGLPEDGAMSPSDRVSTHTGSPLRLGLPSDRGLFPSPPLPDSSLWGEGLSLPISEAMLHKLKTGLTQTQLFCCQARTLSPTLDFLPICPTVGSALSVH